MSVNIHYLLTSSNDPEEAGNMISIRDIQYWYWNTMQYLTVARLFVTINSSINDSSILPSFNVAMTSYVINDTLFDILLTQ